MTIDLVSRKPSISDRDDESDFAISVEGVSKKFCRDLRKSLAYGVRDIVTDLTGGQRQGDRLRPGEFWALKDVSFQLRRGEALGLVGANGAGKSTILRIISGLIKPDAGQVRVRGRVAPLIALGAGFNPILTGRENVYANMAIFGLSKQQIDRRFEAVLDFAEIGDAIDAPVQSYSSGMAARLGFATAIHAEPEILLLDEVLAVGDIRFRAKCARKLAEIRKKGISFILVNHKPTAIVSICDSAIYLTKGQVVLSGDTIVIINRYEEDLMLKGIQSSAGQLTLPEKKPTESAGIDISYICFRDADGKIMDYPQTGKFASLCIGCRVRDRFDEVYLKCKISDLAKENETILDFNSNYDNVLFSLDPGNVEIQVKTDCYSLKPSIYNIDAYLSQKPNYLFDAVENFRFKVEGAEDVNLITSRSLFYQPKEWHLKRLGLGE